MDLLPTFAQLIGQPTPKGPIDGHNILPLLLGEPNSKSPWDTVGFAYYNREQLQAIRAGQWKLYLPLQKKLMVRRSEPGQASLQLFDVRNDVHEDNEVSAKHSDVVQHLLSLANKIREEIGDGEQPGSGQRPAGFVAEPKPLRP